MIADCGVCSTLKDLNLKRSTYFSGNNKEKEDLIKLCDILATAPVLQKCDISSSLGNKNRVRVMYATEG